MQDDEMVEFRFRKGSRMRAWIAGWQIADGEVATPVPGAILERLALRLAPAVGAMPEGDVVVEGTITWARYDVRNGLLESVITADRFRLLTQVPATLADPVPSLGRPVRQAGRLNSVGLYEFDAFGLPDVTQSWLVLEVEEGGVDGFMVEVEPVEFRFSKS